MTAPPRRKSVGVDQGSGAPDVTIELSSKQVRRVLDVAANDTSMITALLAGAVRTDAVLVGAIADLDNRSLSRSLLMGLLVLAAFPADGAYMGVAELARLVGANTSTTHRYVTTLAAVGLVERDPQSRRYRRVS